MDEGNYYFLCFIYGKREGGRGREGESEKRMIRKQAKLKSNRWMVHVSGLCVYAARACEKQSLSSSYLIIQIDMLYASFILLAAVAAIVLPTLCSSSSYGVHALVSGPSSFLYVNERPYDYFLPAASVAALANTTATFPLLLF